MLDFERKTEQFIEKHKLITDGDVILIAVSGGPDSMALLHFLNNRQKVYGIRRIGVVHVDHMLRGNESHQDLLYVKSYCEAHDLSFRPLSIDIKEKMAIDKAGMQETARKYRYRFFEQAMVEWGANKLAVAQHGDDQVETILMRLTRGSAGESRAGISVERQFGPGTLIRPLLGTSRAEVEQYCEVQGLQPRQDPSNQQKDYTRNRFRHEVLPFLQEENRHVHLHFQRFSEELREDERFLLSLAEEAFMKNCQIREHEIELDINRFNTVPLPLQRRVIHLILNYLYKEHIPDLSAIHAEMIIRLLNAPQPSGKLDLPEGLHVRRSYSNCLFTFEEESGVPGYYYELEEGNRLTLPSGMVIQVERGQGGAMEEGRYVTFLDPRQVVLPLFVRTRKPGDRLSVKGMNGTKKVKDVFIDAKVPIVDRPGWPIVTDGAGEIVWIPGLKKTSFDFHPSEHQSYIVLRCRNQTSLGGQSNQ